MAESTQQLRLFSPEGDRGELVISPLFQRDSKVTLYHGDRLELLRQIAATGLQAQLIVTSPPYNIGKEYETRFLRLRSDGSTDLSSASQKWFVTLHHETKGDGLTALPQNYCLLQVDPWTGRCQAFRP